MALVVGEHYYFRRPVSAAGVITRFDGEEFVLRGLTFTDGEFIRASKWCNYFESTIGNTKYSFSVGKYPRKRSFFLLKPPRSPS